MPELPEVETTARELKPLVKGKIFHGLWVAHEPMLRRPKNKRSFLRVICGEKILDVGRRGKIVWFKLTNARSLFIHQKLSGHLMYGRWRKRASSQGWRRRRSESDGGQKNSWLPADAPTKKLWQDSRNRFVRLLFFFRDGSALALSDIRKFGRAYAVADNEIERVRELTVGLDPLSKDFRLVRLKVIFKNRTSTIKQVLLDQRLIAGIGNIYADEILWSAKVSPLRKTKDLTPADYGRLARAIPAVLQRAIEARGTSIDNYRRPNGTLGSYQELREVYRREGEACRRCGTTIKRLKIGQRSSHFCPRCQR